ncbi:RICIN domain-containing protein [Streptomyces sp. YH02]|uniref:RICIN domain-containing protein n=1 Tax=Streptomyces sp. YH02 TaxID=3256999 RepID=UPI0037565029
MSTAEEATTADENSSSEEAPGADPTAVVCYWANVKSRLRMGPLGESTAEGRVIHQLLAAPRNYQQWRLIEVGKDNQDVLYRIENVRSGKVLDTRAHEAAGSVVVQRAYSSSASTRPPSATTRASPTPLPVSATSPSTATTPTTPTSPHS